MSSPSEIDALIVRRIRDGDGDAWCDLIARYEGRLLAFAQSRLGRRAPSEDVVQETFIGFVNSLPNFDTSRTLESYLFSICAHKLTDHMRREGRRPALPFSAFHDDSGGEWEIPGNIRGASSIARSGERRHLESDSLTAAIQEQVDRWRRKGDWTKIKCMELLFVRGRANKDVAGALDITEQQVANFKFDFIANLRTTVKKQTLSRDVFPELYEG